MDRFARSGRVQTCSKKFIDGSFYAGFEIGQELRSFGEKRLATFP